MISAVAQKYHIHPQTLRLYEREGLLKPSRTEGNTRLYSEEDLEQLETILTLTRDLGVNLAGVDVILNMRRKIQQMQGEVNEFMEYVKRELARGIDDWEQRLSTALVKSTSTDLVRANPPSADSRRTKKTRALKNVRAIIVRASVGARYKSLLCLQRYRLESVPRISGIERVARCDCWRDNISKRLIAEARVPRRYHHCTLNDFVTYDNDTLEDALSRSRKMAEEFPVVNRGLFFLGDPGVGKTHLAVAILKQVVMTRGARGLYYDTRDLLKVIRGTYNNVVKTTELDVLRPVMEADLLVLDDLGAEKTSEWVEETLNLIVNTRYNERRATIFTSNYPDVPPESNPEVISLHDRIGFRMRSRLHEMCDFLDLEGADYRMLLPNEGVPALKRNWEERRMRGKLDQAGRSTLGRQRRSCATAKPT